MAEVTHHWECDCGRWVDFKQPELPGDEPASEQNKSKNCPRCGDTMYFDEDPIVTKLKTPPDN